MIQQTFYPATFNCPRRNEIGGLGTPTVGFYDGWRGDDTCSYCGSLEPQLFMDRLEAGDKLIPTDKNYKAYLEPGHQTFYYQHLTQEHRERFINLVNNQCITFGEPGYLYVLPYFCVRIRR